MEDGGGGGGRSTSPGPAGRPQEQDRLPSFHGVKAENDTFRAFVMYKNQTTDIGLFATAQEAARAYDRKVGGGGGGLLDLGRRLVLCRVLSFPVPDEGCEEEQREGGRRRWGSI